MRSLEGLKTKLAELLAAHRARAAGSSSEPLRTSEEWRREVDRLLAEVEAPGGDSEALSPEARKLIDEVAELQRRDLERDRT
ncbi:MAG: hypothetical protein ABSF35_14170 [Polyangia bacterium]|jgi:hypothetical protein